jgi:DNA-binding transcriptional LysR family regulator
VSSPQRLRRLVRHGTLPQLAAFEAVVRLGSVTRAAESLHLAQPTVSGHLRKLADVVGEPLLQLNDRRLRPTAAGLALLDAARDIFAALQRVDLALDRLEESATLAEDGPACPSTGPARPALGAATPRPAGPSMTQRLGERGGWGAAAAA